MIELTDEQRRDVGRGKPVGARFADREVVLLRSDVYRRMRAVLDVERAVIEAGHTRGPVTAPQPLCAEPLPENADLGEVAVLPGERYEEVRELVEDDHERSAWLGAIAASWGLY